MAVSNLLSTANIKFAFVCFLWYSSSAITNNIGKQILNQFKFPITLTFIQFGLTSAFAFTYSKSFGKLASISKNIVLTTAPLALFQICGHILSATALSYVSVSFSHTIKVNANNQALSPMFTVLIYRLIFRVIHSRNVYVSLIVLTIGVMLVCATNLKFHLIGFLCALTSTLIFVLQNIFAKKLFNEASMHVISTASTSRLDKLELLFFSSTCAFVLMFPIWVYYDFVAVFRSGSGFTMQLLLLFFFNGLTHFSQAMLAFSVLSLVSPITYSIASLCKRIFVITASIIYVQDPVSLAQSTGIIITFAGLWLYHLAEMEVSQGEERILEIQTRHSNKI